MDRYMANQRLALFLHKSLFFSCHKAAAITLQLFLAADNVALVMAMGILVESLFKAWQSFSFTLHPSPFPQLLTLKSCT